MTKQETGRAMLRGFAQAAKTCAAYGPADAAWAADLMTTAAPGAFTRRRATWARAYALGIATAWGL